MLTYRASHGGRQWPLTHYLQTKRVKEQRQSALLVDCMTNATYTASCSRIPGLQGDVWRVISMIPQQPSAPPPRETVLKHLKAKPKVLPKQRPMAKDEGGEAQGKQDPPTAEHIAMDKDTAMDKDAALDKDKGAIDKDASANKDDDMDQQCMDSSKPVSSKRKHFYDTEWSGPIYPSRPVMAEQIRDLTKENETLRKGIAVLVKVLDTNKKSKQTQK
jgi:hypothetical protein